MTKRKEIGKEEKKKKMKEIRQEDLTLNKRSSKIRKNFKMAWRK